MKSSMTVYPCVFRRAVCPSTSKSAGMSRGALASMARSLPPSMRPRPLVVARILAGAEVLFADAPLRRRCAAQNFLHLRGQLFQAEGLGQEVQVGGVFVVAAEGFLGIAGHEDHRHVG